MPPSARPEFPNNALPSVSRDKTSEFVIAPFRQFESLLGKRANVLGDNQAERAKTRRKTASNRPDEGDPDLDQGMFSMNLSAWRYKDYDQIIMLILLKHLAPRVCRHRRRAVDLLPSPRRPSTETTLPSRVQAFEHSYLQHHQWCRLVPPQRQRVRVVW